MDQHAPASERPGSGGVRSTRLRRPLAASAVALSVLAAGAGTSYAVTRSAPSGAASPAAAVQALLSAAENNDALGALAALDPGERDALTPGLLALVAQLRRLGVLSSTASLAHISGVAVHFAHVATATTYLTPSLAEVSITGGSATGTADLAALPLGAFVRQHAGAHLSGTRQATSALASGAAGIATVEDGGRWYVSIGDSIAVDNLRARRETGAPPASGAITPTGGATPAAAVTTLLDAAAGFDLPGVVADLPPGEMGALQQYAPDFLRRAVDALASEHAKVQVSLDNLELATQPAPGGTLVVVKSLGYRVTMPPDTTITYANGCETLQVGSRTHRACTGATTANSALASLPPALQQFFAALEPLAQRFRASPPAIGLLTVQEGGRYYVSPVGTLLDDVDAVLARMEPSDLERIARAVALLRSAAGSDLTGAGAPAP